MKPAGVVLGGLVVVVLLIVMAVQPPATGQPTPDPTTGAPTPSATGVPVPVDVPLASVAAYSTLVLSAIALCLAAFIVARDAGPRRGGSWN